jgi:hypothetical protein
MYLYQYCGSRNFIYKLEKIIFLLILKLQKKKLVQKRDFNVKCFGRELIKPGPGAGFVVVLLLLVMYWRCCWLLPAIQVAPVEQHPA